MQDAAIEQDAPAREDWLGVPGLRPGLPIEQMIELLALDILRPVPRLDIDIDPVKYEVAVHRIIASLREGAWTLARTSSSPLVTECGEYMFAVYDAEGHAAAVHAGVLPHVTGTQSGIKFIRYCYEHDSEGIRPGDQFIVNDPYLLGLHTPDVLVARPVFAGDRIVAWVGSLTHTLEMGAKDPGGAADSQDIFQEGLRIPCLKLVREGVRDEHLCRLIGRAVRSPAATLLDITAKIAGNNVAVARLEEMSTASGPDLLPSVVRKLIQESETKALQRIAKIPEGRWHVRCQADHNGREAAPTVLELAAEKLDGQLHFDFTGTSDEAPGPVNCTFPGTVGAIFSTLVTTLFADLHANQGIVSTCAMTVPKGCIYNPRYPAPIFASPPGPMTLLSSAATKLVSEMAMAGGLMDSVCAPWNGNFNSVFMGGVDQFGDLQGTLTMDSNGGGTGGTPFDDGDDTAAFMLAPGSIMSDVEIYEANYPLLYLYRRQRRGSGGHGQWRGGLGGESAVAIHGSSAWRIGFRGLGTEVSCTQGLFGGYPADSSRIAFVRGVDPAGTDAAAYGALLGSFEGLKDAGKWEMADALTAPRPMAPGDVYYLAWPGGGGYGDPLLRDPERVARDFAAGLIREEECREFYGVVITTDGAPDGAETERRRADMRARRLAEASRPKLAPREKMSVEGDLGLHSASLGLATVDADTWLVCRECRHGIGPADKGHRDQTAFRVRNPADIGHRTVRAEWQVYREHYCPSCGVLVDVDVISPEQET